MLVSRYIESILSTMMVIDYDHEEVDNEDNYDNDDDDDL